MFEASPGIAMVAEALRTAVPTLDPAEQRIALQLDQIGCWQVDRFGGFRPRSGSTRTDGRRCALLPDRDAALTDRSARVRSAAWELCYNTVRPHQALGYLTPAEYLASIGVEE